MINRNKKIIIYSLLLLSLGQTLAYFNSFFYAHSQSKQKKQPKEVIMKQKESSPALLHFLYKNTFGSILRSGLTKKWFSTCAGLYCDSTLSKYHINSFIKANNIAISEAQEPVESFKTFNDFFIRKLKPEARPIDKSPSSIISPADGHVIIFEHCTRSMTFPIKQTTFNLEQFLDNKTLAQKFENGIIVIFRLAPWDYHRFHFPCGCTPSKSEIINGKYESVNPLVYYTGIQPLTENERHVCILNTELCGAIAMVSVGALCVGKIIETYQPNIYYNKGDEAGYFCFGGSTLVLIFKKESIIVNPEIVKNSINGKETPIKMGMAIGTCKVANS